jgi:excinuclease ABC subunit A
MDVSTSKTAAVSRAIVLRGVRTHNLKGIDLDLPLHQLIVVTGVSGAGKSSLAFDTVYAEGQRRYVETFSPYARQFLEKLDKPDADVIEGIPPAIAIGRGHGRHSRRSTIGTITEIHDTLGLLFTRAGQVICRNCGECVVPATPASVSNALDLLPNGTSYGIAFPLEIRAATDRSALMRSLQAEGFTRLRVGGQAVALDDPSLALPGEGVIDVVVDRLIRGKDAPERRADSIETAFAKGLGRCRILAGEDTRTYVRGWRCSRCGTDHVEPQPNLFRYNSPLGACPACEGSGRTMELDLARMELEHRAFKQPVRLFLSRWRSHQPCPVCHGARLRPEALAVKIEGRDIAALSAMNVRDARAFIAGLSDLRRHPAAARILTQIESRLGYLGAIGLDYLTLDRPARSLSAGELQRVTLTKTLGSGLVNTLYVLDEPTAGLHPQEIDRLIAILHRLRDQGNTLVVVEHDHALIKASNHVVDLGPGAGEAGGQVLFAGPIHRFMEAVDSPTSNYLSGRKRIAYPTARRPVANRVLRLSGACGNNLKSIDVAFPLGVLCVVTGVSGAGKSTLIEETLYPALRQRIARETSSTACYTGLTGGEDLAHAVFLDQSPLARSPRSNPVTYLKAFDEIRKTFAATHDAKLRNYDAGRFSFNVEGGRCNTCQGAGVLAIDMQFLPDVLIRCPECRGTRYRPEILEITYRGRNIAEVLDLTVRESFGFFRHRRKVQSRLRPLLEIGLDYLRLGQPVSTLSGGEAQRLKLANFLGRSLAALSRAGSTQHTLFLLDEPTAGLHPVNVVKLIEALNALVDRGHSLIVIEHNPEVMLCADWIIDLGPGAGDEGGRLVTQGTPEDVAKSGTPTGQVLAKTLKDVS